MKIRYAFANKEVVEIEVDDAWGNLVIDLDRQEYNNNHAETRRHASLESMPYEGDFFEDERANLSRIDNHLSLREAISRLPERQRQIVYLYFFENLSLRKIASALGLHHATVAESYNAAMKNLKKFF